jgi:nicotinamidase-related amidase
LRIPIVVTLEQPVDEKGELPKAIGRHLGSRARIFEKNFFDLSREARIRRHLAGLKRKQIIVAGCETDVCVMQSCLGLLALGYQIFVVEDLLFSSTLEVAAAIERMKAEGAVFLSYKTLFFELVRSVDGSRRAEAALD